MRRFKILTLCAKYKAVENRVSNNFILNNYCKYYDVLNKYLIDSYYLYILRKKYKFQKDFSLKINLTL